MILIWIVGHVTRQGLMQDEYIYLLYSANRLVLQTLCKLTCSAETQNLRLRHTCNIRDAEIVNQVRPIDYVLKVFKMVQPLQA